MGAAVNMLGVWSLLVRYIQRIVDVNHHLIGTTLGGHKRYSNRDQPYLAAPSKSANPVLAEVIDQHTVCPSKSDEAPHNASNSTT